MSYIGLLIQQEEDDEQNALEAAKSELEAVKKELAQAAQLLNDAQRRIPHDESCSVGKFLKLHKAFPPSHPIWRALPECNCWKLEVGNFILKHANLATLKFQ